MPDAGMFMMVNVLGSGHQRTADFVRELYRATGVSVLDGNHLRRQCRGVCAGFLHGQPMLTCSEACEPHQVISWRPCKWNRQRNQRVAGGVVTMNSTSNTTTANGGYALHDDRQLFEFLCLEGAQAGLSWITILRKREHYRQCFRRFRCRKKLPRYGRQQRSQALVAGCLESYAIGSRSTVSSRMRAPISSCSEQGHDAGHEYLWDFVDGETAADTTGNRSSRCRLTTRNF